jgi:hypothetical protein
MAIQDNKGGFGGTNPNAETPSDNKVEKASGLAQVAKDILYSFFDATNFRLFEQRIMVAYNKLQVGKGTQADKDHVLASIDTAQKKLEAGAFDDAPAGVPQNYFSKLEKKVKEIEVA